MVVKPLSLTNIRIQRALGMYHVPSPLSVLTNPATLEAAFHSEYSDF